ncbi:hypothetical protein HYH03_014979 [Edaphochlamys debaryana]|uniref:Acid phosphatase n=1 Tax=Edaphochlamys debaryana TaxID=47281 RepID=A0A836BRR9_9CHLO|nr:hypothetical protein HYH03_014979 [Edaphochlamys debaryana]|eukprot:KAG2486402.1 hypothetical protein HYH03_014979 [Edaphochlamys debaryana]
MRGQPLPLGAVGALGGALGLSLATPSSQHPTITSEPPAASNATDLPPAPHTRTADPTGRHASSWLRGLLSAASVPGAEAISAAWARSPLGMAVLRNSHADGSGYDAMQATSAAAAAPLAAEPSPPVPLPGQEAEEGPDTITGVFHRLDPRKARLVLVQAVFRHGARTPLSSRREMWAGVEWDVCGEAYKAAALRLLSTAGVENPVSKHDLRQRSVVLEGGCRKGELTLLGQQQARALGAWLRGRYVREGGQGAEGQQAGGGGGGGGGGEGRSGGGGFLPADHKDAVIAARTTNVSRTIATLRGVLTGLYPALAEEGEPFPATTSADLDEILYADTRACPHLGTFQAMAREGGKAAIRSDPDQPWVASELQRLLGLDAATLDSKPWIYTDVHDVLTSLAAHGKPLPPGFEGQTRLIAAINRLATLEFAAEVAPSVRGGAAGRTALRLSMGRLLGLVTGNMRGAAGAGSREGEAKGRPHLYLYSGHDSTIMPLLSALGLEVTSWPPYLSNLVFELWELPPPAAAATAAATAVPRYVVRVLYNQEELPLPHCPPGYLPSLDTFVREVVGPFLLSAQSHAELCAVKVAHDGALPQPKTKPAKPEGEKGGEVDKGKGEGEKGKVQGDKTEAN